MVYGLGSGYRIRLSVRVRKSASICISRERTFLLVVFVFSALRVLASVQAVLPEEETRSI